MTKYRIVKHQYGAFIGYSPEYEGVGNWVILSGDITLFSDKISFILSLPQTLTEAIQIINKYKKTYKNTENPRHIEKVVYEYITENP